MLRYDRASLNFEISIQMIERVFELENRVADLESMLIKQTDGTSTGETSEMEGRRLVDYLEKELDEARRVCEDLQTELSLASVKSRGKSSSWLVSRIVVNASMRFHFLMTQKK